MVIKKKTVLVIDDDPDFSFLVSTILEAKGMDVLTASNIADARLILEKEAPNIIMLDMELHNEHGTDFLKERALNILWSKIPVIVCSSQSLSTVVKSAIRFGADDYLLKPIKQTWLIQRIRKILIKEESLTYYFKDDQEIELIISAKPISVSKTSFIGRSSIGFEKGSVVTVAMPMSDGTINQIDFKSAEKSQFSSHGPFDTLFTTVEVTENEKNRIQLLKSFWSFE
jgi:DNA-binding response OmpR family regulator